MSGLALRERLRPILELGRGPHKPHGSGAACGALGPHDPGRVQRMVAALGGDLDEVHRDERSILMLDCKATGWSRGEERGVCWSPGSQIGGGIDSWREAARRGARGLVVAGTLRGVHSGISGIEPLYWMRDGDAVYFCTRIDPLVATAGQALAVDWDAWAAIIVLGFPVAPRTPFLEVRRLEPNALLGHQDGRTQVSVEDWPWLGVERRSTDAVAAAVVEEASASVRSVDGDRIVCPLSGGWDSRLLISLLADQRRPLDAWSIEPSSGDANEVAIAAAVADRLGIPHSIADASPGKYWAHMDRSFELTDYQCPLHGWLVPLTDRLGTERGTIVDGIGGDIWIKGLFLTEEMVGASSGAQAISLMWKELAKETAAARLLNEPLLGAFLSSARRDFEHAAEPFREHPAGPSLAAFRTRTACGISHGPVSVFGAGRAVAMPLSAEGVIEAAIAAPAREKLDGSLYGRVLERAGGSVARLRSTNDPGYEKDNESRRHYDTRRARRGYVEVLDQSPLQPWFSEKLGSALSTGKVRRVSGRAKAARLLASVAMLGSWERRYRDRLRQVDPAQFLG